ncbi:MAG: stalk domain-containing protein [bacterium]
MKMRLGVIFLVLMGTIGTSVLLYASSAPKVNFYQEASKASLTIDYAGAAVSRIDLKIDGIRYAMQDLASTPKEGEVTFVLDTTKLAPGEHSVSARLYDGNGRLVASGSSKVEVKLNPTTPLAVRQPTFGTELYGTQEIQVYVADTSKRPYVSFFIDNKFRSLRNFPPYTFAWDTTAETNGWHEIVVMSFDEDETSIKGAPVRVFVNNANGRTERQTPEAMPVVKPVIRPAVKPEPSTTMSASAIEIKSSNKTRTQIAKVNTPTQVRLLAPRVSTSAPKSVGVITSIPRVIIPSLVAVKQKSTEPLRIGDTGQKFTAPVYKEYVAEAPSTQGTTSIPTVKMKPNTRSTTFGSGNTVLAFVPKTVMPKMVKAPINVIKSKPVKVSPKITISKPVKVAPKITVNKPVKLTPKITISKPDVCKLEFGTRIAGTRLTFTFNNRPLKFDVAPRVQNGLPIAPFRSVYMQIGGKLDWDKGQQLVTAMNADHVIVLRIGDTKAAFDSEYIQLESAPEVISGRTFVPASFLGKALDSDVFFNPKDGHILINSK